MIHEFLKLVFLSIACGAISMTISKAKVFSSVREWIKSRSTWVGEGISCPYCTSHWVSFFLTLIYFPRPLQSGLTAVDFFTSMMMVVALASITAFVIFSAFAAMTE